MNAKSLAKLSTEDLRSLYTLRAQELNLIIAEGAKRKAAAAQVAHTVATKTGPEFLPLGGHVTENGKPWQAASPEDFAVQHEADAFAKVTGSVSATVVHETRNADGSLTVTAKATSAPVDHSKPGTGQPLTPVTTDGMYLLNGTIYKIQRAVHGSGHLYAKELVIHEGANAIFEYAPGVIKKLHAEDKMTLEQAKEFGHLYGVCCKCGATLTDENSIAAGIGPICAGKGW